MQNTVKNNTIRLSPTLNLICTKCSKVIEINHQNLVLTFQEIYKTTDFHPHEKTIQMFGICNLCRKSECCHCC